MAASKSKFMTVESSGKLYLFAAKTTEDYEATKGTYSSGPIPGKPLTREECIRLASTLLNHANRR